MPIFKNSVKVLTPNGVVSQFFPDESYGHDSSLEGEAANARDFEGGLAHYTALLPLRQ